MTEKELRQKFVDKFVSWVGFSESSGKHKTIIDIYNSHKPLARNYKVKYTDAWCATAVSAAAIATGLTDIIPTECSCNYMIEKFKKMGSWQEKDDHKPQIGDVVFYDWDDNGVGDNKGSSDHVGVVVSVSDTTFKVIEGNFDNSVGYRTMKVNGKTIRGFGIPSFSSRADGALQKPEEGYIRPIVVVKKVAFAKSQNSSYTGTYVATTDVNLRYKPGFLTKDNVVTIIPKGKKVKNWGYYTDVNGTAWLSVTYNGKSGFVSSAYVKKVK